MIVYELLKKIPNNNISHSIYGTSVYCVCHSNLLLTDYYPRHITGSDKNTEACIIHEVNTYVLIDWIQWTVVQ